MKKSILATSLVCALGLSQAGHAYTIIIDGQKVNDANITDFSFNTATGEISLTNDPNANVKIGDGSSGSEGSDPAPAPEPEPEPEPEPSNCAEDAPANVVCTDAWAWPDGESRTAVTIPKGQTLSTPFTTNDSTELRGTISFEARSDTTPSTDIWISTTPGGNTYTDGTYNQYYCQQKNQSFKYSIRWYQYDSMRGCSLKPGQQYYFNIRHSSDATPQSYAHRWRTY